MEAKRTHTPGPWSIQRLPTDGDDEPSFRIDGESTLFLRVAACADGYVPGQNEANALLIAAAPELLGFCADVEKGPGEEGEAIDFYRVAEWINSIADRARALITKATGSPP